MIELCKSKLREQFTCLHLFLRNNLEKLFFWTHSDFSFSLIATLLSVTQILHTLCILPSSVPTRKRCSVCLWKSKEVPETMYGSTTHITNMLFKQLLDWFSYLTCKRAINVPSRLTCCPPSWFSDAKALTDSLRISVNMSSFWGNGPKK